MNTLYAILVLVGLLVLSIGLIWLLAYLSHKHKHLNAAEEFVDKMLPGVDCGLCGEKKCCELAKKIASGEREPESCRLLKVEDLYKLKRHYKPANKMQNKYVAIVKCKGGCKAKERYYHDDLGSCALQEMLHSGCKECKFACVGCGDCVKSCRFGAIKINKRGTAEIIRSKCVGCGECVKVCPNRLIALQDVSLSVQVICNNQSSDPAIIDKCSVGCTHCANCIKVCPVDAIKVVNNVPVIDSEKCIECYKCIAACPHHVISRL